MDSDNEPIMISGSHLRGEPKQLLTKTKIHTERGTLSLMNLGGGGQGASCLPFTASMGYFGDVKMFAHVRFAAGMHMLANPAQVLASAIGDSPVTEAHLAAIADEAKSSFTFNDGLGEPWLVSFSQMTGQQWLYRVSLDANASLNLFQTEPSVVDPKCKEKFVAWNNGEWHWVFGYFKDKWEGTRAPYNSMSTAEAKR